VKLIEAVGDKTLDMLDRGEIQIGLAAVQAEQLEERGFGFYAAPPLELHAVWHSKYELDRDSPIEINIGSWLLLIGYWFVSAFFAKPSVRGQRRRFSAGAFRVELVIAALALFQLRWAPTNLSWQPDFA
jgi:hypothetical protein